MSRQYDKLVRDDIPAVVKGNGEKPIVHSVEGEEYTTRLTEKLVEEVEEYAESGEIEELADVLEVVHAIRKQRGVSTDQLRKIRERKAEESGRFDDGIVLERVEP